MDEEGSLVVRGAATVETLPANLGRPTRLVLPERSRTALLAAAAALVLASGVALRVAGARVELRGGPVVFSLGQGDVEARLQEQQARHERELRALEARLERVALGATGGADREALLADARKLIEAESARQQQSWRANLARLEERALLMTFTMLHQVAGVVWTGGLVQLLAAWRLGRRDAALAGS